MNDVPFMFSGADPTYGGDAAMFRTYRRPSGPQHHRKWRATAASAGARMLDTAVAATVFTSASVASAMECLTLGHDTLGVATDGESEACGPRADVARAPISDRARHVAHSIIDTFEEGAPDALAEATVTDDDGLTLEFEDESTGRIVVYVIPHSGRNQFVVAEDGDDYWTGKISRTRAHRNLARWLTGEIKHHTFKGVEWAK